MLDFIAGEAGKLPIKFERGGAPLLPAVGSVFFTVRDHAGVPMSAYSNVAVTTDPTTFSVSLDIPAGVNTIANGKFFERRTLSVAYVVGGVSYLDSYSFRIIPFLNHSVTPDAVRGFIGVNDGELENSDIDITAAFMKAGVEVGMEAMATALASGTLKEIKANDLVLMRTVLDVLPSLKQRIAQREEDGVKSFERPKIIDFTALQTEAERRYLDAYGIVFEGIVAETDYTIFAVTQDTDRLTGGA